MNNGSANSTPVVSPQVPIVNANPPKQASKRNMLVIFILLAVVTIAVVLFRYSQSQKSDNTTAPASKTPPVDIKAEYQNPFDKSAQYENPFENLK